MRPIFYSLISLFLFLCASCQQSEPCHAIEGVWSSDEGQKLIIGADQSVALVTYFGASASDTFFGTAQYRCQSSPGVLDLLIDTLRNPMFRQSLYGLISWSTDTAFSLHFENGREESARTRIFEIDAAGRFTKE